MECITAHHAQQIYSNGHAKGHDLLRGDIDGKSTALGVGHLLGREHSVAGRQLQRALICMIHDGKLLSHTELPKGQFI